jgi:hypothetical protein
VNGRQERGRGSVVAPQGAQPVKVGKRITQLLDEAPRHDSGLPQGFTHWELACFAYRTDDPSAAQLSAVRRATARLVNRGQAERPPIDRVLEGGEHAAGWHPHTRRDRHGIPRIHWQRNPAGILVRRAPTDADREARAAIEASPERAALAASLADRIARPR